MKKTKSDPLYGEIPLVEVSYRTAEGKEGSYWTYDLAWRPPLPKGAVRGDPKKQNACHACNVPKYWFADEPRRCVECEAEFAFSAKEQKFWYEELRFSIHSTAVRCVDCRKARRDAVALQKMHTDAVKRARSAPDDPCALLALAEAALEFHRKTGKGDLDRALAAARKARRVDPELLESHYWEGTLEAAAGRPKRARESLDRFIAAARPLERYTLLVQRAEKQRHKP